MLRASTNAAGTEANLRAVTDRSLDSGVMHGALLMDFAEALVRREPRLAALRSQLLAIFGPGGLADAAGTAANFQRMVRIADGTGIPLDGPPPASEALRSELGIDHFASAANTLGSR